jgi:methylenetetrahydrofolate reductase (NADPH)
VAHEVDQTGGRSIASLNTRDRNLLGLRRDLLTAAAYHVEEFLLVYGDEPSSGARSSELNVRSMIDEVRRFSSVDDEHGRPIRAGVTTQLKPLASWKKSADFVFVQVCCQLEELVAWRSGVRFDGCRIEMSLKDPCAPTHLFGPDPAVWPRLEQAAS